MAVAKGTQRTYLKERLERIFRAQKVYWGSEPVKLPKPAEVIEAEKRIARDSKIVNRFHKKERTAARRRDKCKREMVEKCRHLIEFGDAKDALKALDRFEKMKF